MNVEGQVLICTLAASLIAFIYTKWIGRRTTRKAFVAQLDRFVKDFYDTSIALKDLSEGITIKKDDFQFSRTLVGSAETIIGFELEKLVASYSSGFIWPPRKAQNATLICRMINDIYVVKEVYELSKTEFPRFIDQLIAYQQKSNELRFRLSKNLAENYRTLGDQFLSEINPLLNKVKEAGQDGYRLNSSFGYYIDVVQPMLEISKKYSLPAILRLRNMLNEQKLIFESIKQLYQNYSSAFMNYSVTCDKCLQEIARNRSKLSFYPSIKFW